MKACVHGVTFIFLILLGCQSAVQANPLFESYETINAVLTAPLNQSYREKNKPQRIWHPGQFAYTDKNDKTERLDVSVRTRGVSRRKNCKLPPLRLNFKKNELKGTQFYGEDKIKLVSPCKNTNQAQQELLLEYLAYRSLSLLTDYSMRTRLLRLSYVDSDNQRTWTHYAFLLETEKAIAKRLGLEVRHVSRLHSKQHKKSQTALIELFQLLIANNDYSVLAGPEEGKCCHNMEVLAPAGSYQDLVMIPYDFDSSGLVNASYAAPPEKLPIKSVRTRYYRGRCQKPETINASIAHILTKKMEIINLFQNNELLTIRTKRNTINYLHKYFNILESPKSRENKIIGKCLGKI